MSLNHQMLIFYDGGNMRTIFSSMVLSTLLTTLGLGSLAGASDVSSEGCVMAGSPEARVTIEEFADFHCRYCAVGSDTMKEVAKNYPNDVKLVLRNMPLPFHNPGALTAAKAFSALCLQSPTLARTFQAELFDSQAELIKKGEVFLYDTANKIGADVKQMKVDMNGAAVAKMISADQERADSLNFKGTPSYLIGTEKVTGARPYEVIARIIDKQLGR